MQITQHKPDTPFVIRGYDERSVRLPERELTASFILSAEQLIEDWPPRQVTDLTLDSLAPVIQLHPEVLVLATGTRSVFPRAQLRAEIGGRGIGREVMEIGAACRTFNVLVSEGRRAVIAVLFP